MTRKTLPWVLLIAFLAISTIFALSLMKIKKPPARVYRPPVTEAEPSWMMALTVVKNQASTAYTESPGAPPGAGGRPYFPGAVAVHPETPVAWGGSPLEPIIPFNTSIHLLDPPSILIQGQEHKFFQVIDTGDVNWSLRRDSPYWIDLFFGTTNQWSHRKASNYGVKRVDYYWYHIAQEQSQAENE
ncbi:MAG: hypothetical protein GX964_06175 [Syntrophomonadaceae bacterium]|jgi:hypothetical protein|nr:hypothetical protein [Syntrophomonadaceae bacterium]